MVSKARWLLAISALAGACVLILSSVYLIREAHRFERLVSSAAAVGETLGTLPTEPSSRLDNSFRNVQANKKFKSPPLNGHKTSRGISVVSDIVPASSSTQVTRTEAAITDSSDNETTTSAKQNATNPLDRLKVPHPIFVASLPKSGTTSTARYFYCGKIWTAHTFVNTNGTTHLPRKQMRVGHCMLNNMQAGRPLLHDCGKYTVWSDAGHPRGTPCFYPSVHGLDAFYQAYPTATILLVTRNSTAWSKSVMRWKNGDLLKKWRRCEHFPNQKQVTQADLERFYNWHAQNLRDFVAAHPSLTYLEVSLEDDDIGKHLEEQIGVPADCFGHHNSHEKRMLPNPNFRKEFNGYQNKTR